MVKKICSVCKIEKPLDEFWKRNDRPNGLGVIPSCKSCSYTRNRDWYDTDEKRKHRNLKSKYGISYGDWENRIVSQCGSCTICGTVSDKPLCVDHDHETAAVRSLLCDNCNVGIARFNENPGTLIAASQYLREHRGT